jgi:hypothetical protein
MDEDRSARRKRTDLVISFIFEQRILINILPGIIGLCRYVE